jgi:MFS family permease
MLIIFADYSYRSESHCYSSILGRHQLSFVCHAYFTRQALNLYNHRCSTVFQPSWASFSHIIGRKPVILAALLLFTIGTIVCSVAKNISLLLVGRCLQGVGGGGLVALTYVVITDMVTLRERGKWMSIISAQWAIGSVLGPGSYPWFPFSRFEKQQD